MKPLSALAAALAALVFVDATTLLAQPGRVASDQILGGRPAFNIAPQAIIALPDGGALVGGAFTNVNTSFKDFLVRVRADGSLNTSFNLQLNGPVTRLLRQPDGKILVGGAFTAAGARSTVRLLRLNADLTLDTGFSNAVGAAIPAGAVSDLALDAEGRVYVGLNPGLSTSLIYRFGFDGTCDVTYDPLVDSTVTALTVQADGKLLVGGSIVTLDGVPSFNLGRLDATGAVDNEFAGRIDIPPYDLLTLADGRVLMASADGARPLAQLPSSNNDFFNHDLVDPIYGITQGPGGQILVFGDSLTATGRIYQLKGTNPFPASITTDIDSSFDVGAGPNAAVRAASYTTDGSVWIAGNFLSYDGFSSGNIVKLQGGAVTAQTITFADIADRTFDPEANSVTLAATTDATGPDLAPITFTLVSGPATLDGNTLVITGAGDITVRAAQAGNATYVAASATQTFTVAKASQTITFGPLEDRKSDAQPFTISATTTAPGLAVEFTVSGPATLSGDTVTLTGASGLVTITARQPGNDNYLAAADVEQSFTVASLSAQKITFAQTLDNRLASAKPVKLVATSDSGLAVEFSASGPASIGPDGRTLTLSGEAGAVTVTASQPGGERAGVLYAAATPVVKSFEVFLTAPTRSQKITFVQPATVTYGTAPLTLDAKASSQLPVTLELVSSTPAGIASLEDSTLAITGAGKVVIRATQRGDATYKPAASVTRTVTVNKARLAVKADDKSRLIGEANPAFTLTYADATFGFVNGDTEADLAATRPVAKTTANAKTSQGDYDIAVTGGVDANYLYVPAKPGGKLHVLGFGGTYEALLLDGEENPVGKLTLTVASNAFSYSGNIAFASQTKTTSFRSTASTLLDPEADGSSAAGATNVVVTTADPDVTYRLAFTLNANGALAGTLALPAAGETPATTVATLSHGARVHVFTKTDLAPGVGANTLVLHPPVAIDETPALAIPGGSGHATAAIATSGVLTLKGKVADGRPLTATLKPTVIGDGEPAYHLWTNPYGTRTESFVAGRLALRAHPDQTRFAGRHYIPANTGDVLIWQKAALPESTPAVKRDTSYRAGFGPLAVPVSLDPWLVPSSKAVVRAGVTIPAGTLLDRLGLADDTPPGVFAISHDIEDLDLGAREPLLPVQATLAANGKLTVANAAATAWSITINRDTGAFSGSYVLSDQVKPLPAKPTPRKVAFSGTLRQTSGDDLTIGAGFFLVPGFATTDEQPSGEIRFTAPAAPVLPTP